MYGCRDKTAKCCFSLGIVKFTIPRMSVGAKWLKNKHMYSFYHIYIPYNSWKKSSGSWKMIQLTRHTIHNIESSSVLADA